MSLISKLSVINSFELVLFCFVWFRPMKRITFVWLNIIKWIGLMVINFFLDWGRKRAMGTKVFVIFKRRVFSGNFKVESHISANIQNALNLNSLLLFFCWLECTGNRIADKFIYRIAFLNDGLSSSSVPKRN